MNIKAQVRNAALTAIAGIGATKIGQYGAEIISEANLPAVLVSVALERTEEGSTMTAQGLIVTLTFRIMGRGPTDRADANTVIDKLEAIEQEIHAIMAWQEGSPDPLGIGAFDTYMDTVGEPEIDDEHETPLAILTAVYGIMVRVERGNLNVIVT